MKTYTKPNLVLELNEDELKVLRDCTQNFNTSMYEDAEYSEMPKEKSIRLKLYVEASRALGYDVNDDGSSTRMREGKTIKGGINSGPYTAKPNFSPPKGS